MVKFPLCKEYFSMLGIINFFSSYFMTLKSHAMIPDLKPLTLPKEKQKECPAIFPHLPITQYKRIDKLKPNLQDALGIFYETERFPEGKYSNKFTLEKYLYCRGNPVDDFMRDLWGPEHHQPVWDIDWVWERYLEFRKELIPLLERSLLISMLPDLDSKDVPYLKRHPQFQEVLKEGVNKMLRQIDEWHDKYVEWRLENHSGGEILAIFLLPSKVRSQIWTMRSREGNKEHLLGLKEQFAKDFIKYRLWTKSGEARLCFQRGRAQLVASVYEREREELHRLFEMEDPEYERARVARLSLEEYPDAPSMPERDINGYFLTKIPSHLTPDQQIPIEKATKRIVGGCGMDLQSQPLVFSEKAEEILNTQWPLFYDQKPEGWSWERDFYLCRLEIAPTSFGQRNYQWMESLIQIDHGQEVLKEYWEEDPQFKRNLSFEEIVEAIFQGEKEEFEQLISAFLKERAQSLGTLLLSKVSSSESKSWPLLPNPASYDKYSTYMEDVTNQQETLQGSIAEISHEDRQGIQQAFNAMKKLLWMDEQVQAWYHFVREDGEIKETPNRSIIIRRGSNCVKKYRGSLVLTRDLMGKLLPFLKQAGITPPSPPFLDKNQRSLLHVSAQQQDPYFTRELLKIGMPVLASDVHGFLPLHYAAMAGHVEQMELLIERAPDTLKMPSRFGATPLFVAIQHGQAPATKVLLKKGREQEFQLLDARLVDGYTPLLSALHEGDLDVLSEIVPFLEPSHMQATTEESITPLMLACELQDVELTQKFIEIEADINAQDKEGYTALDRALKHQSLATAGLLRETTLTPQLMASIAQYADEDMAHLLSAKHQLLAPCDESNVLISCVNAGNIPAAQIFLEPMLEKEILKPQEASATNLLKKALKNHFPLLTNRLIESGVQLSPEQALELIEQTGNPSLLQNILEGQPLSPEQARETTKVALFQAILMGRQLELLPKFLEILGFPNEEREGSLGSLNFKNSNTIWDLPDVLRSVEGPTRRFRGWKLPHFLARMDAPYFLLDHLDITGNCLERLEGEKGKTLAYIAAESGSLHSFEKLLDEMEDQGESFENQYGDRHLLYGAFDSFQKDILDIALCYFQRDINISLETSTGIRAVHLAASQNTVDVLERLEEYRADFQMLDLREHSALYYAIRSNSHEAVEFLLQRKFPITSQDVQKAQKLQDSTILKKLIKAGSSLPQQPEPEERQVAPVEEALEQRLESFYEGIEQAIEAKDVTCLVEHLRGELPITHLLPANKTSSKQDLPLVFYLIELCVTYRPKNVDLMLPFIKKAQEIDFNLQDSQGRTLSHYLMGLDLEMHTYTLLPVDAARPEGVLEEKVLRFDPYAQNENGVTPMHLAAQISPHKTFKQVLDSCSFVNLEIEDFQGLTPLFYAAEKGNNAYVHQLLEKGANPDHRNHFQFTPAVYAERQQKTEVLRTLLNVCEIEKYLSTQKEKITLLHLLAKRNPEMFLEALEKTPTSTYSEDRRKGIAQILARNGSLKALRFLAYKDKDAVISADQDGNYPWEIAAFKGDIEILCFYRNLLPKLFTKEHKGKADQLLLCAARGGQKKTAEWLLDQGLLKYLKRENHIKILKSAALSNCHEILSLFTDIFIEGQGKYAEDGKYFLMEGAVEALPEAVASESTNSLEHFYHHLEFPKDRDLTQSQWEGGNGLQIATRFGALKSTQWLIQNGADLHETTESNSLKGLELAAAHASISQFQYLLENLSDEQLETYFKADGKSQTLLHISATHGHLDHVALLIAREVALNIRDEYGLTALERAVVERRADVALLLMLCVADEPSILKAKQILEETLETKLEKTRKDYQETAEMFEDFSSVFEARISEETPLHLAIKLHSAYTKRKKTSLLKSAKFAVLLLSNTELLNQTDAAGNTPLHHAALLGDLSSARVLIKKGVEIEENTNEKTPEMVAKEGESEAMKQFFEAFDV
jgi:ankyrin repeat protein